MYKVEFVYKCLYCGKEVIDYKEYIGGDEKYSKAQLSRKVLDTAESHAHDFDEIGLNRFHDCTKTEIGVLHLIGMRLLGDENGKIS